MENKQKQVARIVEVDTLPGSKGKYLLIQALEHKDTFKYGGRNYGYRYEWHINKYFFQDNKRVCCEQFGLTEEEFIYWVDKLQ